MRITNMMMQNNMMLNINRNAGRTDTLFNQLATGQKINLPSDDPIVASRALRFRASIEATEQFQRNNDQAISWTSTTSTAFSQSVSQMQNILSNLTTGATDTMSISERKDIATSLRAYLDEIQAQMNTTYAGRYVFSGYRTDEPPVLTESNNKAYSINQDLSYDNLLSVKTYWKQDAETEAEMEEVSMVRLPYAFAKNISVTDSTGANIPVKQVSVEDATNPYKDIGADEVRYVKETGELLLGENVQAKLLKGDFSINYDKENFLKGELNPVVYYECVERTGPITDTSPAPAPVIDPASGITVSADAKANLVPKLDQYGIAVVDSAGNPVYMSYTMDDQDMMSYELSYKTRIQINSLAKDSFTPALYSDLNRCITKVLDIEVSTPAALKIKYSKAPYNYKDEELQKAIDDQISKETTEAQAVIQDEFGTMLDKMQEHLSGMSREYTDLGARQVRLDVIQARLEDDLLNLRNLNSINSETVYEDAIAELAMVESVYDASLKLTAKISQMSLINYI